MFFNNFFGERVYKQSSFFEKNHKISPFSPISNLKIKVLEKGKGYRSA